MLCAGDEPTARTRGRLGREDSLTSLPGAVPILVVDDDPGFCTAVSRALASVPLRPFSVGSAADALRFLACAAPFDDAPRPAFVVLDFHLPDLDAPAIVADLRADPRSRAIPVIVLTQIPGPADQQAAIAAGAQAYHPKPSRAAALRELLLDFWRTHAGPHGDPDR
jgi:putative two-component system response regulator